MQKRALFSLLVFFLLGAYFVSFGFGESVEPRKKPVNSLVQTSGYKNLSSYVQYLQSRKNVSVEASQRGAMSSALRAKASAAYSSLRILDWRRKRIIDMKYKKYLGVALGKIAVSKRKKEAEARYSFQVSIQKEKDAAASAKKAVYYNSGIKLRKANGRLVFLRNQKMKNPSRAPQLNLAIEKTLLWRSNIWGDRGRALQDINRNFFDSIAIQRERLESRLARVSDWAFWASARQKRARFAKKEEWLQATRERYLRDSQTIENKKSSGFGAISQMPEG